MPNIRPVSDLRNYSNVVKDVKYGNPVYLTKNGHGVIAMVSMEELDDLEKELALYKFKLEMKKGEDSIKEHGTYTSEEIMKELGI
ncbi:MAG: type II toxin-antitoxin system prevent-host-death family antitoxin [Catonella sp.]|jgi:prevent-host-death family protein|nr:type II toxin-antitoxin system prevent-host-death family antitoxin [Catonella sp.]MDY6357241.1 type II toxin-antitoxin system prevent-host-death family antitoxin [Catonella sp.]